jgi:type III secretory pathway component EscR
MILFILSSFIVFNLIIKPSLYQLKEKNIEFQKSTKNMKINKKIFEDYKIEFNKLKSENKLLYANLQQNSTKEDIFKIVKNNLSSKSTIRTINVTKIKNKFNYKTYLLSSYIKKPSDFFKFITLIESKSKAITVNFPIKFKSKRGKIMVTYEIGVYNIIK